MSIINIVKEIKQVHPYDVVLIKVGKFYHVYGKDASIIAYLFHYQTKKIEQNVNTFGFPEMASSCVNSNSSNSNFNVSNVRSDNLNANNMANSNGNANSNAIGVRPLASNKLRLYN